MTKLVFQDKKGGTSPSKSKSQSKKPHYVNVEERKKQLNNLAKPFVDQLFDLIKKAGEKDCRIDSISRFPISADIRVEKYDAEFLILEVSEKSDRIINQRYRFVV